MGYVDENGLKMALGFVKNYVDGKQVDVPTPDWNATDGEAGFIKNRTHYESYYVFGTIDITNIKAGDEFFIDNRLGAKEAKIRVNGKYIEDVVIGDVFYIGNMNGPSIRVEIQQNEFDYTLKFLEDGIGLPNYIEFVMVNTVPIAERFIPDTIARTEQFTELSEEVSELSEKVENLPTAESSVFEAIYDETPFADLWNAYQSNKHVVVRRGNFILSLVRADETIISFSAINNENVYSATCNSSNKWSGSGLFQVEKAYNKVTSLSASSTDTQYPSAKAVYDAIQQSGGQGGGEPSQYIKDASKSADGNTLTLTKNDGSLVSFSPSGGSGGGMTTPSGDPMHYLYVTAGAEYNDTGADIERTGMYGDTITWKAGCWWLNELGDITNDQMRAIFVHWQKILQANCYWGAKLRTNLPFQTSNTNTSSDTRDLETSFAQHSNFEVFDWRVTAPVYAPKKVWDNNFIYCYSLKKILGEISATTVTEIGNNTFGCSALEEIRIKGLKVKVRFSSCAKLSYASINYLILNSAATATITLTLHATALAHAEAAYLEDTTQDLATYPTLSDWALSKNIQIATA